MKRILTIVTVMFAAAAASAQTVVSTSVGAEAPRRQLRPYTSVDEAAANSDDRSAYIVPLTEWTREEAGGKTRFTAEFVYPASWLNRQILVRIASASSGYAVEVEGRHAGHVANGAVPAEFNVTKAAQSGINRLTVTVDEPASNEPLTRAGVTWLGKAEIVSQPTVRVRDIDSRTTLNDAGDAIFEVAIAVKTDALNPKQARISYELNSAEADFAAGYKDVKLEMRGEDTVRFVAIVPKEQMWSTENPNLLKLVIRNRMEGRYVENIVVPVGVREVKYAKKRLDVNGQPQSVRVTTVAPNITVEELMQLKENGFNAVTVEAGEAAGNLYAACDSAGLYVIPQVAVDTSNGGRSIKRGGNASNDPRFTDEYLTRTWSAFHTAKSHPSVIAFSLGHGITDGINPYESYLLLKGLDMSRPVIYDGSNKEWNNDSFDIAITRPLN